MHSLEYISKFLNYTNFEFLLQASWVGGLMPLAGLAGGIAGGPFIEYLGRRNTILATAVPFIISWLLIACAVNVAMVLAGRTLAGFCVGIASLSLPVYLGETVQPEVRGSLGLLPTAFGNIGILLCFVAGSYLDWSQLAFLGGTLPVPFLILMFLIPETPRWYISRGREDRARRALQWLRGKQADVEPELKGLLRTQAHADRHSSGNQLVELLRRNNLKPLSISLGLMFFQQLSGINAVIFYTVMIFQEAGSTIDGNLCTIIVGIVNFIATFMATVLIDRLGRKVSRNSIIFFFHFSTLFFFFFASADSALYLRCGHDYFALYSWWLLLLQSIRHEHHRSWLVTIGQFRYLRSWLFTRLRTHTMVDDGRDFAGENSWFCCISGHRLQLDMYIHCDKNLS